MANYDHIHLTKEEAIEAMILAKQKKERRMQEEELKWRESQNRMFLTSQWSVTQTEQYMMARAKHMFNGRFLIDEENKEIFNLLCLYFSEDPKFETAAAEFGVKNPSISKGILLSGMFGAGKSWLVRLFCQNRRQSFWVHNAKDVADHYQDCGSIDRYLTLIQNPINDAASFYHEYSGLCIDDLGREKENNFYGNKVNVIGKLIELRYEKKLTGKYLHGTTNLNAEGLKSVYEPAVISRMREIFNIITMNGTDRRK